MTLYRKAGPRKYEATALPDALRYFEVHDMLISATRYYIGRMTIQTCYWAQCLAKAWPEIPAGTRGVIRRDLEEAFRADDEARERGDRYKPLGYDCDRQSWDLVRQAWQTMEAQKA